MTRLEKVTTHLASPPDARLPMRINQYLSQCGICSRRKADQHIQAGHVLINGEVVTQLGIQVGPEDVVFFKEQKLNIQAYSYLLLNKPKDCISTNRDPRGRRTVFDLLPKDTQGLSTVGRLDRNTTGLLLLTNDGMLAERLSHPRRHIQKTYTLLLDKPLSPLDIHKLQHEAIVLEDGPMRVDHVQCFESTSKRLQLSIHSGRNRVLRRLCAALGYKALALDRVAYASLTKKGLARGEYRPLTAAELSQLLRI